MWAVWAFAIFVLCVCMRARARTRVCVCVYVCVCVGDRGLERQKSWISTSLKKINVQAKLNVWMSVWFQVSSKTIQTFREYNTHSHQKIAYRGMRPSFLAVVLPPPAERGLCLRKHSQTETGFKTNFLPMKKENSNTSYCVILTLKSAKIRWLVKEMLVS